MSLIRSLYSRSSSKQKLKFPGGREEGEEERKGECSW